MALQPWLKTVACRNLGIPRCHRLPGLPCDVFVLCWIAWRKKKWLHVIAIKSSTFQNANLPSSATDRPETRPCHVAWAGADSTSCLRGRVGSFFGRISRKALQYQVSWHRWFGLNDYRFLDLVTWLSLHVCSQSKLRQCESKWRNWHSSNTSSIAMSANEGRSRIPRTDPNTSLWCCT